MPLLGRLPGRDRLFRFREGVGFESLLLGLTLDCLNSFIGVKGDADVLVTAAGDGSAKLFFFPSGFEPAFN